LIFIYLLYNAFNHDELLLGLTYAEINFCARKSKHFYKSKVTLVFALRCSKNMA